VWWGVHLPLIDFGDGPPSVGDLRDYVRVARELGYDTVGANDHLVWRRPWLDGLTALAAVAGAASGMTLATTVALPTVRHPVVLAKALATLGVLHDGPLLAGVGPGSSRADYDAVGIPFAQRWSRFDADVAVLRGLLHGAGTGSGEDARFGPLPDRPPQIWVGSWGSPARLRAMVAVADGWLASGYNTTPQRYAECRGLLDAELVRAGRDPAAFPDMVATVWLHVTRDADAAASVLDHVLAPTLRRDPRDLAEHLPVGTPEHCVDVLGAYARAGVRRVLLWPVGDVVTQLRRFAEQVAPHVAAPQCARKTPHIPCSTAQRNTPLR
jgi:alkanesulfonate monooxygenase SsuD/methylene tetrahydromethanopterin reductase-like flavin-dependent oxidoreductase (luciferase family)